MFTSIDQFNQPHRKLRNLATADLPLVFPLRVQLDPATALERLASLPHCLLLESSMRHDVLGRYSFLMADPIELVQWPVGNDDCLNWLNDRLTQVAAPSVPDWPPFQGGVAGLITYDFNRALEPIRQAVPFDDSKPAVVLGLYDTVIAWDHARGQASIISHGFDAEKGSRRSSLAAERAQQFLNWLESNSTAPTKTQSEFGDHGLPDVPAVDINVGQLGSQLSSDLTPEQYSRMIARALRYIRAGDIFQVNLAQQLTCPIAVRAIDLYTRLRQCNPSPFGGYFDLGHAQIVSASPERLACVRQGTIETRPIKGTRQRTGEPDADARLLRELLNSEKDRAENVMIVDLMRNDLSRICTADSLRVTQLLAPESYASVIHLVSAIQGQLRDDVPAGDLIRAIFPGGSVTGAPKIRAMEIIAELEPTPRGAYCGSLGYFGFDGTIDLNILIRTMTVAGGCSHIPVGGGIVADSDPEREYAETWAKAAGMLAALPPPESAAT